MKNIFKKTFSAFTGAMVFLSAVSMSASAADKEIADILTNGSETSLISYAPANPDMAMPVVLQRTREEHAHEGTHLVVEPVRRGRRDRLVVFVDQKDWQLFCESVYGLAEKP